MRPGPGTYALILFCPRRVLIRIGKLGSHQLRRGYYVYVGSAVGPGGVRARVAHHRRVSRRPHWHIDYLRPHARLERVRYTPGEVSREHHWARRIRAFKGASVPIAGFGCSDCRCATHLFFFASLPSLRGLKDSVTSRV